MNSRRRVQLDLFLVSFLALYLEVALIRWIPGHLRILAYYTNFVLMASFLGLSVGLLLARSSRLLIRWAPPYMLGLLLLTLVFKGSHLRGSTQDIALYEYFRELQKSLHVPIWLYIPLFFALVAFLFVPLGQVMGDRFRRLEPIPAYLVNIVGSIAGVAAFSVFSFVNAPPVVWFAIGLALLLVLIPGGKIARAVFALLLALCVGVVHFSDRDVIWSPYYKIKVSGLQYNPRQNAFWPPYLKREPWLVDLPASTGANVSVNDDFLQFVVDLSDGAVAAYPFLGEVRALYRGPFELVPPGLRNRVLIVGAGCGTDVGQALEAGFAEIDAVEIDPVVVDLGRKLNPRKPYADGRVSVHVEDARAFLGRAEKQYDLVLFSYLDSHSLFSNMSNIRLDSYIYTVECFREARDLLKPGGHLVVSHALGAGVPWIQERLVTTLRGLFGPGQPEVTSKALLVARANPPYPASSEVPAFIDDPRMGRIDLSTDDWPFFYMKRRTLPIDYVPVMLFILVFSLGLVSVTIGRRERWGLGLFARPVHFFYFFLGAAFMLLETKSVTELALVFGSSWFVNSVVFAGILIMVLLANLFALKGRLPPAWLSYALLFASLALNLLIPLRVVAGGALAARILLAVLFTFLPIFFAGLIFASLFRREENPHAALGYNLLGAVVGGLLEYSSMVLGFRALLYFIAALYLLSLAALVLKGRRAGPPESVAP